MALLYVVHSSILQCDEQATVGKWLVNGHVDPAASSQSYPEVGTSVVESVWRPVLPPASIPIKVFMYILLLFIFTRR